MTDFKLVKEVDVDVRRRVSLGKAGKPEDHRYRIFDNSFGEILLVPVVTIPANGTTMRFGP